MGKPHPLALRSRVVAFVEEGHSRREAARHFRVSPRFVNNMVQLKTATGSLAARRQGHGPGVGKLAPHAAFLRARLAQNGELTLDELCKELEGRGVAVHRSNVSRLLHRLGLSHKKRPSGPASSGVPRSGRRASIGSEGASRSLTKPWPGSSLSTKPRPTQG
jgi:transposase